MLKKCPAPAASVILRELAVAAPLLVGELCALGPEEACRVLAAVLDSPESARVVEESLRGETRIDLTPTIRQLKPVLLGDNEDLSVEGFQLSPRESDLWSDISARLVAP